MLPSEVVERRIEQPTIQPTSLPLIPFSQEESFGHITETAPERTKPKRTLVLVTETSNEAIVSESEVALLSTLIVTP